MRRRDFIVALAAGACAGLAADVRGDSVSERWKGPVRLGLKTKVTPYFSGGWTVYMFGNREFWAQMLSTLFVSPSGKVVVVDGGCSEDSSFLLETIKSLGGKVDAWFITHAHTDHYGALQGILVRPRNGGIRIGRLVYSFPPMEWIAKYENESEGPVGKFLSSVDRAGIRVEKPRVGQICDFGEGLRFECLNDFDLGITNNGINNSSICYRVENGDRSLLVTGDIGEEAGERMLKRVAPDKLKADVLFLSHHGQNGAGIGFYRAVKPEIGVWPTPIWLWENDEGNGPGSGTWNTNYVKTWMQELGCRRQFVLGYGDVALGAR